MGGTSVEGMYLQPSKSQWYLYVTYAVTLGISVFYYTAHFCVFRISLTVNSAYFSVRY
jgi:hypothetical protein